MPETNRICPCVNGDCVGKKCYGFVEETIVKDSDMKFEDFNTRIYSRDMYFLNNQSQNKLIQDIEDFKKTVDEEIIYELTEYLSVSSLISKDETYISCKDAIVRLSYKTKEITNNVYKCKLFNCEVELKD